MHSALGGQREGVGLAAMLPSPRRGKPRTPFGALALVCDREVERASTLTWPNPKYQDDPVGFARDVLGVELWAAQVEILESIRDNRNTTVRSGHKCGKSTALAVAALWFWCSFPDARVLLTAVKAPQIDRIIWREIRRLYRGATKRGMPLGGRLFQKAHTGLVGEDDRQIWGLTARDGEGLAGISGANVLILVDEASGIKDVFFEVLGSSLAGSGGTVRKCYISNPTRTHGEFYKSHTTNAHLFKCLHVSSEDTPNAKGEEPQIDGLAGPEWIAEKKTEYGEHSSTYRVRVKGEFVHDEDGKIISLADIAEAQHRWDDTEAEGRLQFGLDPAGDGVDGDETSLAIRRGRKILAVLYWRGIDESSIVRNVLGALTDHRRTRDQKPLIVIDREGPIGGRVYGAFRGLQERNPESFDVVGVKSSNKAVREPQNYHLIRDELWACAAEWVKDGGALPEDVKPAADLNAPAWSVRLDGKRKATSKDDLRKILDRSPDGGDAICLAIWPVIATERDKDEQPAAGPVREERDARDDDDGEAPDRVFNPYRGAQ